jgi:hypothetical protein
MAMTAYERQCYHWLRRGLREELGIPFEGPGRKRKLTDSEARAIAIIVLARPHGARERLIEQIAERLAIGRSTLRRAVLNYRLKSEASTLQLPTAREVTDPA